MKPIRKFSFTLHLWLGLVAAIFLFVEGITGGIMAWGSEILRLTHPPGYLTEMPIYHVPSGGTPPLSLEALVSALEAKHPGRRVVVLGLSHQPDVAWSAVFRGSSFTSMRVWFDPRTGEEVGAEVTGSRAGWLETLVGIANRLHRDVAAGVMLLLLAFSGIILWWPRKILVARGAALSARTNFELHSAIGFYSSVILVIFSVTSVIMIYQRPAIGVVARITHTAASPSVPRLTASMALPRGGRRLDLDESMRAAMEFGPAGSRFMEVGLFNRDALNFFYQPAGGANDQEGLLVVRPATGKVEQWEVSRNLTFAERVVLVQVPGIHTGDFWGATTRWIGGFFSFMLAVLAVTGPLIWWNRWKRRRG